MKRPLFCLFLVVFLGPAHGLKGQVDADSAIFEDFDTGDEGDIWDDESEYAEDPYYQSPATTRYLNSVRQAAVTQRRFQDSIRYDYFMKEVYRPALGNSQLPAVNRRFLVQMKHYLKHPADSSLFHKRLLCPVYFLDEDTLARHHILVEDFQGDLSFSYHNTVGWPVDAFITVPDRKRRFHIFYSNAPVVKSAQIRRFRLLSGSCEAHKAFELRQVSYPDSVMPAFCSPFNLELVWESDSPIDSLLQLDRTIASNLRPSCDDEDPMVGFARLKGVPRLWFATNEYPDSNWPYPTRGLLMDYKGEMTVWLWRHQIEMVGCSCL